MRKSIIAVSFIVLLNSCEKKDFPIQKEEENLFEITEKSAIANYNITDSDIDLFFNSLPDKIETDYISNKETHTFKNGAKKINRILTSAQDPTVKTKVSSRINKVGTTVNLPDDYASFNNKIPGAKIKLVGKYLQESNSYYQSEFISNPMDHYPQINRTVSRKLMGVTRWMTGNKGNWRGYVNYILYGSGGALIRTKQVEWAGAMIISQN